MNRMLLCGLTAVVGLLFVIDTSDAGLFRRRRAYSSNACNPCNTCTPQVGWQSQQGGNYDPNYPSYNPNSPPPYPPNAPGAPGGQAMNAAPNAQQGNTTFYRGNPNLAPQQPTSPNDGARLQTQGNVNARTGNANLDAQGNANLNTNAGGTNAQGGANLNTNNRGANVQGNAGGRTDPAIANPGNITSPGAADQRSNAAGSAGGNP